MALLTSAREPRRMTAEPVQKAQLHIAALHGDVRRRHRGLPRRDVQQADGFPGVVLALVGPDVEAQVLIDPRLGHADELRQGNLPSDHLYPDQAQVLPLQLFIFPGEHPLQELLPCHAAPHS